jgi:putative oxidoreductase
VKIAVTIARILLGIIFVFLGSNLVHTFLPMPPPTGLASQYFTVMAASHYLFTVGLVQVIGGLLLLVNRYVPLALVLLGAVIANILLFHILMAPSGLPLALVVFILWCIVAWHARRNLAGILAQRVQTELSSAP